MAEHDGEKPDSLEIVAIGKLYNGGPWDKKYWSSSRGKDRYPYPVGYRVVRTQNQIAYTMEILEGLKGPLFMISSTDGQSCSGQTPNMVWDSFQKKGCVRIKLWHGKRLSCKIDGVELFGFKNSYVQRLLRELTSNANLTEQSLLSSSFNNGASGIHSQDHTQCTKCCKAPCTCPNFQPEMGKPQVTRKRNAQNKAINVKSKKEGNLKRVRQGDEAQNVDVSKSGQCCSNHFNNGHPSTSSTSKEERADLETLVEDGNCPGLAEYDIHLHSRSSTAKEEAITFFKDKELSDRSNFTNAQGFSLPKQEEEARETYFPKDSQTINDMDLFAPDTLDLQLDGNYDPVMDIPKEIPSNTKDDLNASQMVVAEDSIVESRAEEPVISTANDNSEKCDTDSVGHEITESMMTVLLPRALPLLKAFSRKKKTTAKSAEVSQNGLRFHGEKEERNMSRDESSPAAELRTEDLNKERQMKKDDTPRTDFGSVLPNFEDSASVAPDSFENDQCDNTESTLLQMFQGVAEADHSAFGQYPCIPESIGLYGDGNSQQGHASDSITNFCPEINLALEKGHEKKDNLIAGFMSPNIKDMCIGLGDSLYHETQSEQKDVKTSPRPNEGAAHATSASSVGILCIDNTLQEGLSPRTGAPGTGNVPVTIFPDITNSARLCKAPQSENSLNLGDVLGPETCRATKSLPTLANDQVKPSFIPVGKDSIADETRLDVQSQNLLKSNSSVISEGAFCKMTPAISHEETAWDSGYNDFADACNASISWEGKPYNKELFEHQGNNELNFSMLRLQDQGSKSHNKTETNTIDCSNLNASPDMKHNSKIADILELVGCYAHPMPISTVLMRTKGNEMYICVLCGHHMGKDKSVFVYKVPANGKGRGCPSIIGHSSLVSPHFYTFGREIELDSSSLQLTPDGQCIVLHNSIKAPYCSVGNVYCPCSVCTSVCFETNAVKIVEVKRGYVSAALKLKTTDTVSCILVCEPCYLLVAEESGRLHLWTMNSSWTDTTKQSYLSTSDCMPGCIVEMKRIPKSEGHVVGKNAFGEFCLWDISKQILVSKFSAPQISVSRFLPVSLFRFPSTGFGTAGIDSEEYINNIMDETNMWSSKGGSKHASFSRKGDDMAVCLLISSVIDPDFKHGYQSNYSGVNPVGCWSLALLARNTVLQGNTLDPRAVVVGASDGYGIMSTCDKLLYMWELSKGTELGALQYCKGANVSCIEVDDSDSGAFAIACDDGQLQVYMPSAKANEEKR